MFGGSGLKVLLFILESFRVLLLLMNDEPFRNAAAFSVLLISSMVKCL